MYQAFYGLHETPFTIAPNPAYLFLSSRHQEALTYLTYGLRETGGFVLLTGEVGTGKTTITKQILDQLPEDTDTAFVLNPNLTTTELFETLCDELSIPHPQNASLKHLTDLIHQHLLKRHQENRHTVFLIDEAQHLKPEVLEQLRLLTNLETHQHKLLQIVLIGQPELQHMLKQQALRQLSQRITARYHLLPLTQDEVGLYVQHRLQVAGRHQMLFKPKAIKALYQFSQGIPRLINLIADRALIAGYARYHNYIDQHIIKLAAQEVIDAKTQRHQRHRQLRIYAGTTTCLLGISLSLLFWQYQNTSSPQTSIQQPPTDPANIQPVLPAISFSIVDKNQDKNRARQQLLSYLNISIDADQIPCLNKHQSELLCYQHTGTIETLKQLNAPAIVTLKQNTTLFFATLVAIKAHTYTLQIDNKAIEVDSTWFQQHFTGQFEIVWRPQTLIPTYIGPNQPHYLVQWLDNQLSQLQNLPHRMIEKYDGILSSKLKQFQQHYGLKVDGIAGQQTLIFLTLLTQQGRPKLIQESS